LDQNLSQREKNEVEETYINERWEKDVKSSEKWKKLNIHCLTNVDKLENKLKGKELTMEDWNYGFYHMHKVA